MRDLSESLSAAFAARPDPELVPVTSLAVHAGDDLAVAWGADPDALFQAASISKSVAAFAAMRLVAAKELGLDVGVNEFLTSWQLQNPDDLPPVTVRHLLCHSGALTVVRFPGDEVGVSLPTITQILAGRRPANTQPVRRDGIPGQVHEYSGGGFMVLQQLLEDVTGQPFAEMVRDLVFGPVMMKTATYAEPVRSRAVAPVVEGDQMRWCVYPELAAAGL